MTVTAPAYSQQDRLVGEVRRLAEATRGRGMSTVITGEQLRAVLERVDTPPPVQPVEAPEPAWQVPLAAVIPVLDDVLQDERYIDLIGCNLVDVLTAWAARNDTTVSPAALAAVTRSLAGG